MNIEQIYTGCLAQGAYYIVSDGEAAIIDPLREVHPYLDRLLKDQVKLKYIFETHFHADFVSGHLDLSKATGAPIIYGPTAKPDFEAVIARDGEIFSLGKIKIKALHTPGHTLESTTYLLLDENGKEQAIFSGDTLFIGDVGRPDLAQKDNIISQEDLAGLLYDSLQQKIINLPDDVLVYPAHGAGSACGKKMRKETFDTLGSQKKTNYALNQPNKSAFIKEVLDGLAPPPKYFGTNVSLNKSGYQNFDEIKNKSLQPISAKDFEAVSQNTGSLILDTRNPDDFSKGYVPNSINIGLSGDFAPWVGSLIVDVQQPLLLVTYPGKEEEAITRLSRVGFDQVIGYLEGGFASWIDAGLQHDAINRITIKNFAEGYHPKDKVIDVRKTGEYDVAHIENAESRPLDYINEWIADIDDTQHFYLHCAGGYRSMIASSILHSHGIRNFSEIEGGFSAIKNLENIPLHCSNSTCENS